MSALSRGRKICRVIGVIARKESVLLSREPPVKPGVLWIIT
jgi:hypothetical protein